MSALAVRLRTRAPLHPGAWWAWAAAMAAVAAQTTNPLLLVLLAAVVLYVAATRQGTSTWSRSIGVFLRLAIVVVVLRVGLQVLFGARFPGSVLFTLPRVPLPRQAEGVSIGGPVTTQSLLAACGQGLRLADVLLAFGSANTLANPYRLLRCLPGVLYESGLAVTVALAYAPELVETVGSVRAARRLRGRPTRGLRGLRGMAVPVLEGALDRSLELAASMDARGFGRRSALRRQAARRGAALTAAGMLALLVGAYLVLASAGPAFLGIGAVAVGIGALAAGIVVSGRRQVRTRYRPEPWRGAEWGVLAVAATVVAGFALVGVTHEAPLQPAFSSVALPAVPVVPALAVLLGVLPAIATPPSRRAVASDATGVARRAVLRSAT